MDAINKVRFDNEYSEEIWLEVGVHQESVLSHLLFLIALHTITEEYETGCPRDLFQADDLALIAVSLPKLETMFRTWKQVLELKGLRVN